MSAMQHTGPARGLVQGDLDAELIRALQEDGRASIHELSLLLGVSRDVVSNRMHHLMEREGLSVVAAFDPVFAGHRLLTHAGVDVDGPVRPVAEALAAFPEPVFISMVSGVYPLVFESRHGDTAELDAFLDRVRAIPSVRRIRLTAYAEVLKGFFVADYRGDLTLDEIDHEVITILQADGRTSYRSIAETVHLSPSSVRARVRRMVDAGAIRISAIKSGGLSRNRVAVGFGVNARQDLEPIRRYIVGTPAIEFAARAHGVYDFIGTVTGQSSGDVLEALERLRMLPEVDSVESWAHLNIVEEGYARAVGVTQSAPGLHWTTLPA